MTNTTVGNAVDLPGFVGGESPAERSRRLQVGLNGAAAAAAKPRVAWVLVRDRGEAAGASYRYGPPLEVFASKSSAEAALRFLAHGETTFATLEVGLHG